MIRIRDSKNNVTEIPHHVFVEICDGLGDILYMIYADNMGEIHVIGNNTQESILYQKIYKTKFVKEKPTVIKK